MGMMGRGLLLVGAGVLLVGACAGGNEPDEPDDDGASSTSTTTSGSGGSGTGGMAAGAGGTGGVEDPCEPGFADCDGIEGNGCEIRTVSHALHCGMCNNPCPTDPNSTTACVDSMCELTCNAGFEDCDDNPDCEAQLANDPNNCGMCGETCAGTCTNGTCDPLVIAANQNNPLFSAVDATHVYWTNAGDYNTPTSTNGSLMRAALPSGMPEVLATGLGRPTSLVLDGGNVIFGTQGDGTLGTGTVQTVPATGGTPTVLAQATGVWGVAVDATHVYFSNSGTQASNFTDGSIARVPLGGGAVETLVTMVPFAFQVVLDGNDLLFSSVDLNGMNGSIQRVAKTGGVPTAITNASLGAYDFVNDGTNLFFGTEYGAGVYSVPVMGGTVMGLGGSGAGISIALDGSDLYYASINPSGVNRIPTAGGMPEAIAPFMATEIPFSVQTNATYVVFTTTIQGFTQNQGRIMAVPK